MEVDASFAYESRKEVIRDYPYPNPIALCANGLLKRMRLDPRLPMFAPVIRHSMIPEKISD